MQYQKLNRRDFLKSIGFSITFSTITTLGKESYLPKQDRLNSAKLPNIVWITCEDISANLGCYGDNYARTPSLDSFAADGIKYTHAFGVTGVCAPNRSCLITGIYPTTLGSHDMRSTTRLPDHIRCFTEYLRQAGYYCTNNVKTDYNFPTPKTTWDECSRTAHWRNRKPDQPFFAVFNYTSTHESRIRQSDESFSKATSQLKPGQRHDPTKAPVPPFHPDTPEVRKDWARYYDLITALDYQVAGRLKELEEAGLSEDTIVFFFSDHGAGMPGCKKWIWHSGLHIPLIIRFPHKYNKWAPSKPGSTCERLVSFVDFAPTVLSLAGVKIPEHMQGYAFLGEQTDKPRKYIHAHRDRMAERYDIVRVLRDRNYHYIRNFTPHLSWSQYVSYTEQMPTMKAWRSLAEKGKLYGPPARYFHSTKPVEELYDTKTDQYQIHNLANNPKYKGVLERMRAECYSWMKRTNDLGLLPEYEFHKRAANSTPLQIANNPQHNPVQRLLQAADLANRSNPADLPILIAMLKENEPAVRWWATIGLVALRDKAALASNALIAALKDPSPNVRIAAAEALCNLDYFNRAMPVLIKGLHHPTPFIRLRAMNVLDRLGSKARPALLHIQEANMTSKQHPHVASYLGRIVQYVGQRLKE